MSAALIRYGLIAFGAVALIAAVFFYRGQAAIAQAERAAIATQLSRAVEQNKAKDAFIKLQDDLRAASDKLVLDVSNKVDKLRDNTAAQTREIEALKKQNAEVLSYLERTIPDDLKRLLNNRAGDPRSPGATNGSAPGAR